MTHQQIQNTIQFISDSQVIDYDNSFKLSKFCSLLLRKKETEKYGRDIVIRILDVLDKVEKNTYPIWNDLTAAAGLFPYVDPQYLSQSELLRYEYHKSPFLNHVYLHEEQQDLSIELQSKKSLVVSAPTSFGKSLLIEELIASMLYKHIVIIQPTLALLDETRKKLLKYREQYKIIVSTSQNPSEEKGNIFLFTGERVVEYYNFPKIEFFVIDEFYKLSLDREDDRAIALNQAFDKLLKHTNKFYLLGPMIKDIPINFKQKFELTWYPTEFATVAVNEQTINVMGKPRERKEKKRQKLFELLSVTKEQTIIYCSSPNRATDLAFDYVDFLEEIKIQKEKSFQKNQYLSEWIKENINTNWSLIKALSLGIGIHQGALPRHLGSSIVDGFNDGSIRWLFCTSTLIEGVNTSAKNVVLFDKDKGTKPIDYFDYKNIAGRSGRMKRHYIGNVIRFEPQPEQMDLFVDIPIFNQENAPLEILISLEENDIEERVKHRLTEFNSLSDEEKAVIKSNTGISVKGQLEIIKKIESNLTYYNNLLNWTQTPKTFDNLSAIIELCWDTFAGSGDKTYIEGIGRLSARWLASFTFSYINSKSINAVISQYINDKFWINKIPDKHKRVNVAVYAILHISRHWFDYKLPKWLNIISNLQEYVFKKHNMRYGNYNFLASSLENGFLSPNIASLMEYGIPISAIKKMQKYIDNNKTPEDNIISLKQLSDEKLSELNLLQYEIQKFKNAL